MAISKLNPRHASEGRSIAAVLAERIDYSRNPEKTDGGLLVTGYQCSPETAWREFAISKQIYTATTGRRRAPDKDVISYLIIQPLNQEPLHRRRPTSWATSWLWNLSAANTNLL